MLVTNCNRVGKSFHLAPVSEIDDGVFELIVFPRTSRFRLLKANQPIGDFLFRWRFMRRIRGSLRA